MVQITPGLTTLEQVLKANAEGDPYYPSPEQDPRYQLVARAAVAKAKQDEVIYQLERIRFDIAALWVRGELDTLKFNHYWESIDGAEKLYDRMFNHN